MIFLTFAALASAPRAAPQSFDEVSADAGVDFHHRASKTSQKYLPEAMGAGVSLLDFDGDGLLDIFFVNGAALDDPQPADARLDKSAPQYWNRLYRNKGEWRFEDVTAQAGVAGRGYGMGAAVGDFDNDGYPDLYVTNYGSNILYRNKGDGSFHDVTEAAGVAAEGWSSGAAFLDFDRDGLLDLLVVRYLDWDFQRNIWCGEMDRSRRSYCHPRHFRAITHLLYRNRGDGTFEDVSEKAGLAAHPGKGLGVAVLDFDGDGWPDVFVANDSYPQQLFRNVEGRRFEEVAIVSGVAYDEDGRDFAGMGTAAADYDGDGLTDIFVNALARQGYWLYRNLGGGEFEPVSTASGVAAATSMNSGWGAGLEDFDNDGWRDLFVAQGHVMDDIERTEPNLRYLEPLMLLRNVFGRFFDVSAKAGSAFRVPRAGRGAAFGDLDNDGRLDIVINSNGQPAALLRNRTANENRWLGIKLIGSASPRDGAGAEVRAKTPGGRLLMARAGTSGSYLSASDGRVHFGLGAEDAVASLEIRWPSGVVQRLEDVPANRYVTVEEPARE